MKKLRENPKVGDTLFALNVGNAAWNTEQKLTSVIVTKVGRKYFTCSSRPGLKHMETIYHLECWLQKTDYSPNSRLYKTRIEWENEKESYRLMKEIGNVFTAYGVSDLTLDCLRKIKLIIDTDLTKS